MHHYHDYATAGAVAEPTLEGMTWRLIPGHILAEDVLSALPWRVVILDRDGTIIGFNEAWLRLTVEDGMPSLPETAIGLSYFEVGCRGSGLSGGEIYTAYAGIRDVLEGRRSLFTLEYPCRSRVDAEQRWFQLIVTPLANRQPGALIQQHDITSRKLVEKARDTAVREREEATVREWSSREASRQMELFMALAGHEIRTPLTVIKGQLQLAGRQLGPAFSQGKGTTALASTSAQESLDAAQRAANRLTSMLDDLLQVTNAKAGRIEMRPEWCELIALVREQVAEHRLLHPSRRLHLHLERQHHIFILADPVRVTEVLTNYLNNACKYSPESMPIDVELHVDEGVVRMSVRDRGPGLSPDAQAHVWERFYQAPGIKPQSGGEAGLGLGLYISRVIVEQHGGKVGVNSTVGKGATFWCTLPLTVHDS
jgi:signal transduction histidine kinase